MKNRMLHYFTVFVHKIYVARGLFDIALGLMWRALTHDLSKFGNYEARIYAPHIPKLRVVPYGSPEYKRILKKMKDALDLHCSRNRHHPEHWRYGLHEMDAVDLCEMLCDWSAASRLNPGGNLLNSIDHNQERFHTGSIMADVFRNTAVFRWGPESEWKRKAIKRILWAVTIGSSIHFLCNWLIEWWTLELLAAPFIILSIRELLKERYIAGAYQVAGLLFVLWGYWNLFYYLHLGQWASLVGGVATTAANMCWLALAIKYRRR